MDYEQYLNAMQQQINANNAWSASQAQKQMDFQERMSNTSHQREMEDLKASGLNPILSAHSGATTPNGAMASADGSNQAIASILDRILGIEADNAKANLIHTYSGVVGSNTSLPTYSAGEIAGLANLAGLRINANTANALNRTGYYLGEQVSNMLGLSEDSKARQYLSGNWSLQDSINALGNAVQNVKTSVNNLLSSNSGSAKANGTLYGNDNGVHFRTSSATNTKSNSNGNWIINDLKAIGNSIVDFATKNVKKLLK